jgi:hypothetical protein
VFSTKERRPFLPDRAVREALHAYLGGISKTLDCPPVIVGGMEDHVHLLARFGRTITQAEWVKIETRFESLVEGTGSEVCGFPIARWICGLLGEPIKSGASE